MNIQVKEELIDGILMYAQDFHPKEIILLLSGSTDDIIEVNEVILPPASVRGLSFSEFQPYLLPFDLSILGLVHSHPSGALTPSIYDLNHFYGRIMMITAYPYQSIDDIAIFNAQGHTLPFKSVP